MRMESTQRLALLYVHFTAPSGPVILIHIPRGTKTVGALAAAMGCAVVKNTLINNALTIAMRFTYPYSSTFALLHMRHRNRCLYLLRQFLKHMTNALQGVR